MPLGTNKGYSINDIGTQATEVFRQTLDFAENSNFGKIISGIYNPNDDTISLFTI